MKPHGGQPVVSVGLPLGQSHAAMIMLHGRNAAPRNILELVPLLDRPQFTYLAPAAAGNAWYPYSFMSDTATNQPGLSSALWVVESLIADLVARGIQKEHIALLGFSQGGCLTAEFAARHADRYGGAIVLSGGLIGPQGTKWDYPGSLASTPVFLGCSDVDAHIPKSRVDESAVVLARMGGQVTKRIYPGMGHTVNDDEIALTRTVMDGILASAPR
jgi:predicted esterase